MTLNVNEYYFHSMTGHYKLSLDTLDSILSSGYIKSVKEMDFDKTYGMHKPNEICLTEYTDAKVADTASAFDLFVSTSPTLILDKDIEVYKPIVLPSRVISNSILSSGNYTNIYDEVRCNSSIPTSHIMGVAFPLTELLTDEFKYLFYTNELVYDLTTMGFDGFLASALMCDKKISNFSKKINLKRILKLLRKILKENDMRVPIYDFYQKEGEPVFELLKRR